MCSSDTILQGAILRKGMHGSSEWLRDMVKIDHNDLELSQVRRRSWLAKYRPTTWAEALALRDSTRGRCHVLVEGRDWMCEGPDGVVGFCQSYKKGGFEAVKSVLRWKFSHSRYRPGTYLFDPAEYNVAWHLRTGDITLLQGNRTYFEHLWRQIQTITAGLPIRVFFFSSNAAAVKGPPPGFGFLPAVIPGARFVSHLDPPATMYHLVTASMVIETGSSFPAIAHEISTHPLFLFGEPKELLLGQSSESAAVYATSEVVPVSLNGTVLAPLDRVREAALSKWEQFQQDLARHRQDPHQAFNHSRQWGFQFFRGIPKLLDI